MITDGNILIKVEDDDLVRGTFHFPKHITMIGPGAFKDSSLTHLCIPSQITLIGNHAFENSKLISVKIMGKLEKLEESTFKNCKNLISVILPNTLKEVGGFGFCSKLKSMTLPESVEIISKHAFENSGLRSIKLSKNLKVIGRNAFYKCEHLSKLDMSNCSALEHIMQYACGYCPQLKTVRFPDSLKKLEKAIFIKCVSLNDIELPPLITSIPCRLFKGCRLKTITMLGDVTIIASEAFMDNCLTRVDLPPTVRRCERLAFANNKFDFLNLGKSLEILNLLDFTPHDQKAILILPSSIKKVYGGFRLKTFEKIFIDTKDLEQLNRIYNLVYSAYTKFYKNETIRYLPEFELIGAWYFNYIKPIFSDVNACKIEDAIAMVFHRPDLFLIDEHSNALSLQRQPDHNLLINLLAKIKLTETSINNQIHQSIRMVFNVSIGSCDNLKKAFLLVLLKISGCKVNYDCLTAKNEIIEIARDMLANVVLSLLIEQNDFVYEDKQLLFDISDIIWRKSIFLLDKQFPKIFSKALNRQFMLRELIAIFSTRISKPNQKKIHHVLVNSIWARNARFQNLDLYKENIEKYHMVHAGDQFWEPNTLLNNP